MSLPPCFPLWNTTLLYGHATFLHSAVDGHFDFFHFLAIVNDAALNTDVEVLIWTSFASLIGISRGGSDGSYGSTMLNILRN